MICRLHAQHYWHVFMGRGVTRYECLECLRRQGFIVEQDRLGVSARYATAAKSPPWAPKPVGKDQLMAGR